MAIGTVIHGEDSDGGSGMGWDGQVEFRGDLPITLGTPPIGDIWLVEKPTTVLGIIIYQSGLYLKELDTGSLSDWRRLNVKVTFQDNEFTIVKASDNTAKSRFDLSLVSASQTRVLKVQDKDGTIALLSDLSAHGLPTVLGIDNTTGVNDIEMTGVTDIKSNLGNQFIRMGQGADEVYIASSNLIVPRSIFQMQPGSITFFGGNFDVGTHYSYTVASSGPIPQSNYVQSNLLTNPFSIWGRYGMEQNNLNLINSFNFPSFPFWASAQDVTINQNVVNVIAGGKGFIAKTDDAIYSNRYILSKLNEAFELVLEHTTPTADRLQTYQDSDGIIALLSDTVLTLAQVLTNGNIMLDGQTIDAQSGGGQFNPRGFGVDNWASLTSDDGLFTEGYTILADTFSEVGFMTSHLSMNNFIIQLSTNFNNNTDLSRFTLLGNTMFFQVIDNSTGRTATFGAGNNTLGDVGSGNVVNMPFYVGSQDAKIIQNVINSGVGGGLDVIVKTSNSWYVQQLIFNWNDQAFETVIDATVPTADRTQTLQDADGIIALTSDIGLGALKQKSGEEAVVSFAGNPKKATVTFATPFADANYSVSIIGQGADSRIWTVETKLAGSFVINANANPALTNPVLWTATKHGEN